LKTEYRNYLQKIDIRGQYRKILENQLKVVNTTKTQDEDVTLYIKTSERICQITDGRQKFLQETSDSNTIGI